jgi:predicted nucleotide-binding protein
MTNFPKVAKRFHGDVKVAQGVPFSIAALEEFIAIGSSDGYVRLFDANEHEIKVCHEHKLKGNAVTCVDVQRLKEERNVFVVSGHIKGHVALYEVKGLLQHYN